MYIYSINSEADLMVFYPDGGWDFCMAQFATQSWRYSPVEHNPGALPLHLVIADMGYCGNLVHAVWAAP